MNAPARINLDDGSHYVERLTWGAYVVITMVVAAALFVTGCQSAKPSLPPSNAELRTTLAGMAKPVAGIRNEAEYITKLAEDERAEKLAAAAKGKR